MPDHEYDRIAAELAMLQRVSGISAYAENEHWKFVLGQFDHRAFTKMRRQCSLDPDCFLGVTVECGTFASGVKLAHKNPAAALAGNC